LRVCHPALERGAVATQPGSRWATDDEWTRVLLGVAGVASLCLQRRLVHGPLPLSTPAPLPKLVQGSSTRPVSSRRLDATAGQDDPTSTAGDQAAAWRHQAYSNRALRPILGHRSLSPSTISCRSQVSPCSRAGRGVASGKAH
jgi:hypothetical protein